MAKSTIHQANAIATQTFSALCAGCHQTPSIGVSPVWTLVSMESSSGKGALGHRKHFPHAPGGEDREHDHEAQREQQIHVVEEPLADGQSLVSGWLVRRR